MTEKDPKYSECGQRTWHANNIGFQIIIEVKKHVAG